MKASLCALASVVVVSGLASAAFADDSIGSDKAVQDRSRFGLTAGLFTPIGELGAEYTYVATPYLEIGVAAGVGDHWNPQGAIMPRLRLTAGRTTFTLGEGLSVGEYTDGTWDTEWKTPVLWANSEAGVQQTWSGGTFARFAAGFGVGIAHGDTMRVTGGSPEDFKTYTAVPYGSVTVGHTL